MNLNMSELDRFMFYLNKDAKWFYGYPDDELFKRRFEVTVRALRAIKNIRGSKFLLVVVEHLGSIICSTIREYLKPS